MKQLVNLMGAQKGMLLVDQKVLQTVLQLVVQKEGMTAVQMAVQMVAKMVIRKVQWKVVMMDGQMVDSWAALLDILRVHNLVDQMVALKVDLKVLTTADSKVLQMVRLMGCSTV